jgi:hypothetical protein
MSYSGNKSQEIAEREQNTLTCLDGTGGREAMKNAVQRRPERAQAIVTD